MPANSRWDLIQGFKGSVKKESHVISETNWIREAWVREGT